MAAKKIIILTGEIQTGKTTTLFNWVNARKDVAGILTPVKDGKRFFYSIPDAVYYKMEAEDGEDTLQIGRFIFSAAQFEKTNDSILKWLSETNWKYLVIDEIGPLELNQKKGLWRSLDYILNRDFEPAVVLVVRKSLSQQVKGLFDEKNFDIVVCSADEFPQLLD